MFIVLYRNTFIEPWFIFKKSRREKAIARTATEMRIMKWDTRNMLRTSSWIPIILIIISAKKINIFNSLLIVRPFWSHSGTCLRPSVQSQCLQSSTPDQPSLVTGQFITPLPLPQLHFFTTMPLRVPVKLNKSRFFLIVKKKSRINLQQVWETFSQRS